MVELLGQVLLLGPAPLPTITPVKDEELEAECVDLDSRLKADAQVIVVHLVELRARVQKTDVARDGEKEVVVERRQLRKLILQHLGRGFGALTLLLDAVLDCFGEDLIRKLTEPILK